MWGAGRDGTFGVLESEPANTAGRPPEERQENKHSLCLVNSWPLPSTDDPGHVPKIGIPQGARRDRREEKKSRFQLKEKEFSTGRTTDVFSNTNGSDQPRRSILQSADKGGRLRNTGKSSCSVQWAARGRAPKETLSGVNTRQPLLCIGSARNDIKRL